MFPEICTLWPQNASQIEPQSHLRNQISHILALTPYKPVVGHRSGKQMKTHWLNFIKNNGEAA